MGTIVDARHLACPQPVILTRKALAEASEVTTVVTSATSRDNVRRMAEKAGYRVAVEEREGEYHLLIQGGAAAEPGREPADEPAGAAGGPLVLVVPDKQMGRGDGELGEVLVRGFFHTLGEVAPRPEVIIFFNAGVWLVIDGSPVLEDLRALVEEGVEILACGTCLAHYGITDRLRVGVVSNMYDIAETMLGAGRVVQL
jgi:selenium metabolism protein YedF